MDLSTSENSNEELAFEVDIPSGVTAAFGDNMLSIQGKLGTIKKDITKLPVDIMIKGNRVVIRPYGSRKKDRAISNTCKSLITNMIKGVENGYTYKLKIVYAHFPISVKVKDREVHVDNFFGERSSRVSQIVGELTKVSVSGEDVIVQGPSLENVSQTAEISNLLLRLSKKIKGYFWTDFTFIRAETKTPLPIDRLVRRRKYVYVQLRRLLFSFIIRI